MRNFEGIDIFVKVIQAGSFSGAARILGIPATTVSGKIAHLEKSLGATLIHRTTRKLNITQSGQIYFEYALKAISELEAAENRILVSKNEPEGILRLTAPPDIGHAVLPPLVRKYQLRYNKVKVDLTLTNEKVDLIKENIDLAIRAGELEDSTLLTRVYTEDELCLWASSSYLKSNGAIKEPEDLQQQTFIGFTHLSQHFRFVKGKYKKVISITPKIIINDFEAIKIFILSGQGIGILPRLICEKDAQAKRIQKLFSSWDIDFGLPSRGKVHFVYPPQKFVPLKVSAFIDLAIRQNKQG